MHWTCEAPSPYNDVLFLAVAADPEVRLCVHYRASSLATHPWHAELRKGYKSRLFAPILGIDWPLIWRAMASRFDGDRSLFILGGWRCATTVLLSIVLWATRQPFAIWTDTPNVHRRRTWWLTAARNLWLRWFLRRPRWVLATGQPALAALGAMGVPERALVNFPYWIDIERCPRPTVASEARSETSRNLRIISAGRVINELKGHDVVVRAMGIAARRSGMRIEYRIAGSGPDEGRILELARDLGLEDNVTLLGWLDPADLARELADADVFVHPSPVHEPYGVAILEAMAVGLPVLASDRTCAGLDRILQGTNGFLHPAGDSEALAEQLIRMGESPALRATMGNMARRTAEQWPVARAVAQLKDILGERAG